MKKRLLSPTVSIVALIAIMIGGVALAGSVYFVAAQTSTPVSGIINSDTTWTKANSPYVLTGNALVDNGATLTIEAGAIVNINTYFMRVNGTLKIEPGATLNISAYGSMQVNGVLVARGNSTNPIHINGAAIIRFLYGSAFSTITLTQYSANWNEQNDAGSIIENTIFNSTLIYINNSPKINSNTLTDSYSGIGVLSGSPVISNNKLQRISIEGGSPIISNNNITTSGIDYSSNSGGQTYIHDNTIANCQIGINFEGDSTGDVLIEKNLIINNNYGIQTSSNILDFMQIALTIQNNTIANNARGIVLNHNLSPTMIYNNIQNNSQYSIQLGTPNDINATYNWWGTTDQSAINLTIQDFKNDFNLGKVNFVPFLTELNPEATPHPKAPLTTPTPTPSQTGSPSPSIPEFSSWIILPTFLIATILAVLIVRMKKN